VYLDFSSNKIDEHGVAILCQTVDKFNWKPINYFGLNLSNCKLKGKSLYQLCQVLHDNIQLKKIEMDFSKNRIDSLGIKGVFMLIDGCRSIQHLKLDLSENNIDDNSFIDFLGLKNGFNKNQSLLSLDINLRVNQIGNLGMVAFWKNFAGNRTIERISFDISQNKIDEKGFDSLCAGLK